MNDVSAGGETGSAAEALARIGVHLSRFEAADDLSARINKYYRDRWSRRTAHAERTAVVAPARPQVRRTAQVALNADAAIGRSRESRGAPPVGVLHTRQARYVNASRKDFKGRFIPLNRDGSGRPAGMFPSADSTNAKSHEEDT